MELIACDVRVDAGFELLLGIEKLELGLFR